MLGNGTHRALASAYAALGAIVRTCEDRNAIDELKGINGASINADAAARALTRIDNW